MVFNINRLKGHYRKFGKSIILITVLQTFGTFFLVAIGVFLYTKQFHIALIFGGLASATAPAATVVVLREYKASGPLTSTLFAVVALDDALAIMIYTFASAYAKNFIGGWSFTFKQVVLTPAKEIFGSLILGAIIGILLSRLVMRMHSPEELVIVVFGSILICAGFALEYNFSLILANMALGMTLVNLLHGDKTAFNHVMSLTPPIYILFFFLVGARLQISLLTQLGGLSLIFIVCRIFGKYTGSYIGGHVSGAEENIKNYLGLSLLPLGGVAVGLSIQTLQEFRAFGASGAHLGLLAVNVVAISVFVFEMIGPPFTRYAILKAGESHIEEFE